MMAKPPTAATQQLQAFGNHPYLRVVAKYYLVLAFL